MDAGSGIAQIQAQFSDSLEKLKLKESALVDMENQLQMDQQRLEEDRGRLIEERRRVSIEEERFLKEKELMATFPVDESDIIELNVQGTYIQTQRSTLTQLQDTYLAGLFDSQPKGTIYRDREGKVFLDFTPTIFRLLLDYLTELKLSCSLASMPLPQVPDCYSAEFNALLKHLGLEEAIYGSPEHFSRTLKSSTIILREDGLSATSTSDVMGYILGEGVYCDEAVEFSLEVQMLEEPWIFIGVMEESNAFIQDTSFNGNPHAFGWAGLGGVWIAGEKQIGGTTIPANKFVSGLKVKLLLDCREMHRYASLRLTLESDDSEYLIDRLPRERSWRLHINMVGSQDTTELVDVRKIKE